LPHEKALVERRAQQPFSLLGVYGREGDPAEIAARMRAEGLNWRNALDLGTAAERPLWSRWAVRGFPQFYLLDGQGVIRAKWFGDPGLEELERAIDALLMEAAAK
jgi:hypothetical protein